MEGGRKLEVAEYKPKVKDEKTELQASLAEKSLPAAVSSFSAAQVMQQCRSLVLRSAVWIRKQPLLLIELYCPIEFAGLVVYRFPHLQLRVWWQKAYNQYRQSGLPPLDVVKFVIILVNISDSNRILTKWLTPRTFQKLRKCRVCCSFLMAQPEVLWRVLKECLVGWVRP